MESAEIYGYEIYKENPKEAFTIGEDAPLSVDEENYHTWLRRRKERVQLRIKNDLTKVFGYSSKGKNKGKKKRER